MKLSVLKGEYSIYQIDVKSVLPDMTAYTGFYSVTKTEEEVSIVCQSGMMKEFIKAESGWYLIKVEDHLDFDMTGIISSISKPLADSGISIFVLSTFDTDYFMVKSGKLDVAVKMLSANGFEIKSYKP